MEENEGLSDSELQHGLPSDSEGETPEEITNEAVGFLVPRFINQLREEARPLLSLSKGVPSPTKQLKENGYDKPKESRAKKRLFRGKQEPPNGVIERRYGYIPNPRWGKSVSNSQGRQFVPQGVTDQDRTGVPGVVFRDCQANLTNSDGSFRELEFPQLGGASFNDSSRLSPVPESTRPGKQPRHGKGNQRRGNSLLDESAQSHRSVSPVTSTPVRWGENVLSPSPGIGHSSLESTYHSAREYSEDSTRSLNTSDRSVGSSNCLEKSLSGNWSQSFSSNKGKRAIKKLAPSPLAATSVPSPVQSSSKAGQHVGSNSVKLNGSWSDIARGSPSPSPVPPQSGQDVDCASDFNPVKLNNSWSDIARSSPSPSSGTQKTHMLSSPGNKSFSSQTESGNQSRGNAWSQVLKRQQNGNSVPESNKQVHLNSQTWPLANFAVGKNVQDTATLAACNESLTDVTNQSQSPWRRPKQIDSEVNSLVATVVQDEPKHAQSQPIKGEPSEVHNSRKPEKQRKNKQRKTKGSGVESKAQPSSSVTDVSQSVSPSPVRQHKDRQPNFKGKSSNKGPSTLTLEHFMAPQKVNNKKNGMKKEKKDMLMLENRFVEQIAANPTSPPKKLRPSPIKKISFGERESERFELGAGGDARSTDLQNNEEGKSIREYKKSRDPKTQSVQKVTSSVSKNSVVFSMKQYFKDEPSATGDVFEEENEDEDEYPELAHKQNVQQFWGDRFALPSESNLITLREADVPQGCGENENDFDIAGHFLSPLPPALGSTNLDSEDEESVTEGNCVEADPTKVQQKQILIKKAQRYCHYFEEHQVPNIAVELYFVIQLLTCTEVDKDILHFVDLHYGRTVFRSTHNGVYFAVKVIKRLRRLFASLSKSYVELLAECERIKDFSPFLHKFFKQELQKKIEDPPKASFVEHSQFSTEDDGLESFPDANSAHVFKCQRDNFYAFYRHYHDTNSIYELKIENQIQYVYDGCTAEQNSMVNLMHLAKLFVDHLVLCCVTERQESVDLLEMIQAKGVDEKQFTKLYEAFFATTSSSSGTASPAPGFSDHQMFFRDFLETLSSPAFNEHLKNLLVTKILELNAQTFTNLCNLHSAATLEENQTPMRSRAFTETVLTLSILAKVLGYLTFAPYTSGYQSLSQKQANCLLSMREMSPLPLPLPLLLKQAFHKGHLSLTVPWVVEFLSQMDSMASQLSTFKSLLRKLHFIQSYAWARLYRAGHTNSGLLIVSCISWLFESPPVPSGFFYTCKSSCEDFGEVHLEASKAFHIDHQKLVSRSLLTSCCPYLEQGQVLMTLFSLKQKVPAMETSVIPLTECSEHNGVDHNSRSQKDIDEIERWLGSSLHVSSGTVQGKTMKNVIDDEVVPAYVLTRLLSMKATDDLEDMENYLLQSNPFMKSMVENVVDVLCAKVARYTHTTILKLLVFTCKAEVRQQFQDVSDTLTAQYRKNQILTGVNVAAARLSETAKTSFYQVAHRVCESELPSVLRFLSSPQDKAELQGFVCVACRMCLLRLSEWSQVQLGPELFARTIKREAMKCARVPGKPVALYPNDYSRKIEEATSPDITPGFVELEQLSELIDTALSHGVWYINALTPGQRPSSDDITKLIQDFTSCVEKRMITMDFAFYVMSNFLMHLIIQYMVDAPSNWTEQAEKAFLHLCVLCKERKLETETTAVHLATGPSGRKHRPGLRMKVKVLNLLSVHTLAWLAKTQVEDETMMVYCRLLCSLVIAGLLHVETVCSRLAHSRSNTNLSLLAKTLANRAIVKVLSLLYCRQANAIRPPQSIDESQKLEGDEEKPSRQQVPGIPERQSQTLESYNQDRVIALVNNLWSESSSCHTHSSQLEKTVVADLIARLEVAFGDVLIRDGSVCSSEKHEQA